MSECAVQSLADLLLSLRRKINESAKENHLKYELTAPQLEALWFIGSAEERSMESIAHHLHIKPPSATALVNKMEKDKLVLRTRGEKDRRVVNIALTEKTRREFTFLKKQKEKAFNRIVSKLSANDKAELERILLLLIEK